LLEEADGLLVAALLVVDVAEIVESVLAKR